MKINTFLFSYFLNFYSANYIINDTGMIHNTTIKDLNTENSYLENNIIVNNILCSPAQEYDNLFFFIFNLINIDNPSFFLVVNNNQLYKKSNLNKKYHKSNILNNNLIVNTVLSNSINSNINNLTITGNSINCGNSKSETSLTGSLITINAQGIYTNKFNTNIRSSRDIIFEKDLEIKSKLIINDIQASNITINDDIYPSTKNVSFSNTVNLSCNDFTINGSIIFNNDFIINSNNFFLFTSNLNSPINFLITNTDNKVFQTTKAPINEINYFIDTLVPINSESTNITINSQNNEFKMIGDGIFYCSDTFKCTTLKDIFIDNLEINSSYYPTYPVYFTINQNMQIKKLTPQAYNQNDLMNENYINIVNLNIPTISLSGILNNQCCSSINSQCIFKNINITDYSLGPIIWTPKKFSEDFTKTFQILYYTSWNNVITKDMINFLQYINNKKNQDIESKKIYINILIKKIYDLLFLIKKNTYQDPDNITIQLRKIMEQI